MGWWCSGVHVRFLVLVVLPYKGSVLPGGRVHVRLLVLVLLPY